MCDKGRLHCLNDNGMVFCPCTILLCVCLFRLIVSLGVRYIYRPQTHLPLPLQPSHTSTLSTISNINTNPPTTHHSPFSPPLFKHHETCATPPPRRSSAAAKTTPTRPRARSSRRASVAGGGRSTCSLRDRASGVRLGIGRRGGRIWRGI